MTSRRTSAPLVGIALWLGASVTSAAGNTPAGALTSGPSIAESSMTASFVAETTAIGRETGPIDRTGGSAAARPTAGDAMTLDRSERALLGTFAGWPIPWQPDDSNRGSGHPMAIAAGARLFFDANLSANGALSCATCHDPQSGYTDGRARAKGIALLPRNAPTIIDTRWQRWFGWGGAHDNLWAQTLKALVTPDEMGGTAARTHQILLADPNLRCAIEQAFDVRLDEVTSEAALVLAGKAMAAFQETIISPASDFDRFVAAMEKHGAATPAPRAVTIEPRSVGAEPARADPAGAYPAEAQAGFRLFVGKARCHLCHFGPRFTNDEFDTAGVPYFVDDGVDKGRYQGLERLRASPWTRAGAHSDAPHSPRTRFARFARRTSDKFGAFKVPSLRNLLHTAPYMHDGSLPTLESVVDHYSELNEERLHDPTTSALRPLHLSALEKHRLLAFLRSLSAPLPADNRDALQARLEQCTG